MTLDLLLSPNLRGTPDRLDRVIPGFIQERRGLRIASQQVNDRTVVDAIAHAGGAKILLEGDYLRSSSPAPDPWHSDDSRESHRQALVALLRSGCEVRIDRRSSLQHANLLFGTREGREGCLLTSANLAPGSIRSHFNWALAVDDRDVCGAVREFFDDVWAAAPTRASLTYDDGATSVRAGVAGEAIDLAIEAIDGARRSVAFAYFNLVAGARVTEAMRRASTRGVAVVGIVDGDQAHQRWDGAPSLRESGADVRYYPGALTGAAGRRMHYKMFAVDTEVAHASTANASASAEDALELGVSWLDQGASNLIDREVRRLHQGASVQRPRRNP